MKGTDPFMQLQKYMQMQKQKERAPKTQVQAPPVKDSSSHIPSIKEAMSHISVTKLKSSTPIHMENRQIKPKDAEKKREESDKTHPRPQIRPSPLRIQQNNTKDRVIIEDSSHNVSIKSPMTKSVSQKSYDFVQNHQDADEERYKKHCQKRQRLVNDYHENSEYWNRETPVILQEISKSPNRQKTDDSSLLKKEHWEDPRLTLMKEKMLYHKEKLKDRESNAVLKGHCQLELDNKLVSTNESKTRKAFHQDSDKNNTSSAMEGRQVKSILYSKETESEKQEVPKRDISRGKSPGIHSPIYRSNVNNIIPSSEKTIPEDKKAIARALSPLKYKYDFCSQIIQNPVESRNEGLSQSNQETGKNRGTKDKAFQASAFRQNQSDQHIYKRPEKSPEPQITEKRSFVLTPSRKKLINEFREKMNCPDFAR
jgi:hypothetical protein